MKKVVIYTGPMCNFCSAAKHLLNKKKVSYEEIDIGYDEKKREEMLKKSNGMKTIPQIFIEEKHIGGYVELKALENKGELDSLLGINKGDLYNLEYLEQRVFMDPKGLDLSSLYQDDGYLTFRAMPIEKNVENDD